MNEIVLDSNFNVKINAGYIDPKIGDVFQGGIVFYTGATYCLISAQDDISSGIEWGCSGTLINATGLTIGTGHDNTYQITTHCATRPISASLCSTLNLSGYTDWYLPSRDELSQMYYYRNTIGRFTNDSVGYWSSSEIESTTARYIPFTTGTVTSGTKSITKHTRPIRTYIINRPMIDTYQHWIGEFYGGGIIFYLTPGTNTQHGLIMSTSDITNDSGVQWGCEGTNITTGTAIGTGLSNTNAILAGCATRPIAASVASSYNGGGYNDWYLPSHDELREITNGALSQYLTSWITIPTQGYWQSSQGGNPTQAGISTNQPYEGVTSKSTPNTVRAIRSF